MKAGSEQIEQSEVEKIETDLLLEAVFRRYGYDFRSYARASIDRRVRQFVEKKGCSSAGALIPKVLHDPVLFQELLLEFSITVSSMFRDPLFYQALRREAVPLLRTYPFIRVWVAGCASGEEAYSVAILLQEEELLERTTLFATDINDKALAKAKQGIFPLESVREYAENYQQSGPADSFSRYFHADQKHIIMNRDLRRSITFANHNLASDQVFGEMHLILCRNVMIYFNQDLKERVLRLLDDSLIRGGFLCFGAKEMLQFSSVSGKYDCIDGKNRIYRKRVRGAAVGPSVMLPLGSPTNQG